MSGRPFFTASREISAGEIARLSGSLLLDPRHAGLPVRSLAPLTDAAPGDLVFADGRRQVAKLSGMRASAIVCTEDVAADVPAGIAVLVSRAPQRVFAQIGRLLFPDAASPAPFTGFRGVSPAAHVAESAAVEDGAIIEAGAVVGAGAQIGSNTVVAPNAVVGPGCTVGRDGFIGPNATIQHAVIGNRVIIHSGAQIGQDGFGYIPGRAGPEKVPQLGRVVIQDGVEIGANTTIDRGALDDTVIGENAKIDNLVQIAHNVRIGRNCLIASHTGISGSVTIGDNAMLGGQVGIADHVVVGANVQIAAASGVMNDVPAGQRWGGAPAMPFRDWMRGILALRRLAGETLGRKGDV